MTIGVLRLGSAESRMSGPSSVQGSPITDKRQLVEYHASGCKPPEAWRIGTEHEKFVFRRADLNRVPYYGPDGIRALLEGMTRFGWEPVLENGNIIALSNDSQCSITLEPGGQFELSGGPLETVRGIQGKAESVDPPNNNGYERTLSWTAISKAVEALTPFASKSAAEKKGFDTTKPYKFEPFTPTLPEPLGEFHSFLG